MATTLHSTSQAFQHVDGQMLVRDDTLMTH